MNFLYKLKHWETWHYLAKYIPIMPFWLWYCARARSFWFFTASNPGLTFGGFEGETKSEMYAKLPAASYPSTMLISHDNSFEKVLGQLRSSNICYPFIVKPDKGMMGFMFREIANETALLKYHEKIGCNYLIQKKVLFPLEVSVFYYRHPSQTKGNITGFIRKEYMQVVGNGFDTLEQLIDAYPRASLKIAEIKSKHAKRLNTVLKNGEIVILSHALNLSRGGKLVSLETEKDDALLEVFDQLSRYSKDFYYGRYDIKCASIEALKKGTDFSILEFNGCGAEPHHIYGNNNNLFEAYSILLTHWKHLYAIASYNNAMGLPYWNYLRGYRFLREARQHFKALKKRDFETAFNLSN